MCDSSESEDGFYNGKKRESIIDLCDSSKSEDGFYDYDLSNCDTAAATSHDEIEQM